MCDDQNACTDNTCDYADGTCDFLAVEDGANCDFDGFRSICISGVCQPECESPEDCDDENDCTEELCVDGTCELVPVTDGAECDDGNECTADMCANGVCEGTPVEDGTACRDGEGACEAGTCMSGLLWPIDCVPGETCDSDVGYPDLDEDGRAFDCVSPVNAWHRGTGIGITWEQMDAGVEQRLPIVRRLDAGRAVETANCLEQLGQERDFQEAPVFAEQLARRLDELSEAVRQYLNTALPSGDA